VAAYEAIPWFAGIQDRPGETESAPELADMLRRTELVSDISIYFLYEAADAVLRMENCKLDLAGVVLQMLPDFYLVGSQLQRINQVFKDQGIDKSKLMLTVPEELVRTANKATQEILSRYLRNGIVLVLDGYRPGGIPLEQLQELGFTHLRPAPDTFLQQETANALLGLTRKGFTLLGGNADTPDACAWLLDCGARYVSGTVTGVCVSEDELIRDALAGEK
jgi:EAL domain-containing protein (putative c-di-GMP-specific phosphodiesterase class I)